MISYEASKWYIKIWRERWYLYAIFLYLKSYLNVDMWVDYMIDEQFDNKTQKRLKSDWIEIKRHVELTKMSKYTSNYKNHERE